MANSPGQQDPSVRVRPSVDWAHTLGPRRACPRSGHHADRGLRISL